MNCLTSFFNRPTVLLLLLVTATTWGCGAVQPEKKVHFVKSRAGEQGVWEAGLNEVIAPEEEALMVVLPLENLSATKAPLPAILRIIRSGLAEKGFRILDEEKLEEFRKKYRMRYTGGVGPKISKAIKEETGADVILITSLESYYDGSPPQISLISRLVTSGNNPRILWIDSVGLDGDASPGLLGIHRIRDHEVLTRKAVSRLTDSLVGHLAAGKLRDENRVETRDGLSLWWDDKYEPYDFFRSPLIDPKKKYSVAVIPFLNLAVRKDAGKILGLHYVRELFQLTDYKVIEPGVVRDELLRFRAIMPAGPSLAVTDLITSVESLATDLVLTGRVFIYHDETRIPKADFSIQVIGNQSRQTVFGARSFADDEDGVWFYDWGRVYTAHDLVEKMVEETIRLMTAKAAGKPGIAARVAGPGRFTVAAGEEPAPEEYPFRQAMTAGGKRPELLRGF